MAKIKKIDNKFFVEFFGNGLRFQKFAGYSEAEAQKLKQKIEATIINQKDIYKDRFVLFENFCEEFKLSLIGEYSVKSIYRIERAIFHFQQYIEKNKSARYIQDITPRLIEGYRVELIEESRNRFDEVKVNLINLTLFILDLMFNFSIKQEYTNDNPLLHIPYLGVSSVEKLSDGEINDLDKLYSKLILHKDCKRILEVDSLRMACCSIEGKSNLFNNLLIVRGKLIQYLILKGMPILKISEHVNFKDIARWVKYLPLVKCKVL